MWRLHQQETLMVKQSTKRSARTAICCVCNELQKLCSKPLSDGWASWHYFPGIPWDVLKFRLASCCINVVVINNHPCFVTLGAKTSSLPKTLKHWSIYNAFQDHLLVFFSPSLRQRDGAWLESGRGSRLIWGDRQFQGVIGTFWGENLRHELPGGETYKCMSRC